MRTAVRLFVVLMAAAGLLLGLSGFQPVQAAAVLHNPLKHQHTNISADEKVENVIAVGGDADIAGTVTDTVFVINGNVNIRSSAVIEGPVIVIGGKIQQAAGAKLQDNVINFSMDRKTQDTLLISGLIVLLIWLLQLAVSFLMVLVPTGIAAILSGRLEGYAGRLRTASGRTIVIGLLVCIISGAFAVLLVFTVIGLPLAFVLILLTGAAALYGMTTVHYMLGRRFAPASQRGIWKQTAVGSVLTAGVCNIPILGAITAAILACAGVGLSVLLLWERLRGR